MEKDMNYNNAISRLREVLFQIDHLLQAGPAFGPERAIEMIPLLISDLEKSQKELKLFNSAFKAPNRPLYSPPMDSAEEK